MHPKIGGDELVDMFLDKLRDGAKLQFLYIERDNDKKRRFFEVNIKYMNFISTQNILN